MNSVAELEDKLSEPSAALIADLAALDGDKVALYTGNGIYALRRLMVLDGQLTDANAALFDVAHNFHGCIPGINDVLARQGLLEGRRCLDPSEDLSPGQADEITRVARDYPHLTDGAFITEHLITGCADDRRHHARRMGPRNRPNHRS